MTLRKAASTEATASEVANLAMGELGLVESLQRLGRRLEACRWYQRSEADFRRAHPHGVQDKVGARLVRQAEEGAAKCRGAVRQAP